MSVLVTGGAGFIGSHFIELLLSRDVADKVVCLDDFNDGYDPARKRANAARWSNDRRVTVVEQSFCDADAMRTLLREHQARHVVHLGARAGVRASFDNPRLYNETNVRGTLAMLEAARGAEIERFVLVSSSTVYGLGALVPFLEDAPLGVPMSPYGVTKRAAELLGQAYWQAHRLGVVCVRPFSVYGPRMRPDLAMSVFAESIAASRSLPLYGDGTVRRDFTHVRDICQGLLTTLSADGVLGEAINLGHHQPFELRELIAMLEEELGAKANIDRRPAFDGDMPLTCADLTKAKRLLGYEPKMSLREGVADFVRSLRDARIAT